MFLTIDPGAHPGWCLLDDDIDIIDCGINAPPRHKYKVVLVERPTIYPFSEASPANIITLAITLGRSVGRLEELGLVDKLVEVEPRAWKGQIPKKPHHASIRRTLPPTELARVDRALKGVSAKLCEDAMDAVGLAMYGRRMRIFA